MNDPVRPCRILENQAGVANKDPDRVEANTNARNRHLLRIKHINADFSKRARNRRDHGRESLEMRWNLTRWCLYKLVAEDFSRHHCLRCERLIAFLRSLIQVQVPFEDALRNQGQRKHCTATALETTHLYPKDSLPSLLSFHHLSS